jgi:hypothetical protein
MSLLSFKEKFIRNRKDPIHLIRTKDSSGRNCHYFIMASGKKIEMFKKSASNFVDLNEYGVIIHSDWGHEPKTEAKQMLKQKYNFDADNLN